MNALAGIVRGIDWRTVNAITAAGVVVGMVAVLLVHTFAAPLLFTLAFALLAMAAGYTFDEPAGDVIDVAPIGRAIRAASHAVVLLPPAGGGLALVLATAVRGPHWSTATLAMMALGNVAFGFAVAALCRLRTAEPGRWAAVAVTIGLLALPSAGPIVHAVHAFPAARSNSSGLAPDAWWSIVCTLSLIAIALSIFADDMRWLNPFAHSGATERV